MSQYKKGGQLFPERYLQGKRVDVAVCALLIIIGVILGSRQ
jgi:hypothetical protein